MKCFQMYVHDQIKLNTDDKLNIVDVQFFIDCVLSKATIPTFLWTKLQYIQAY
jgi:hypothetical protein